MARHGRPDRSDISVRRVDILLTPAQLAASLFLHPVLDAFQHQHHLHEFLEQKGQPRVEGLAFLIRLLAPINL